MVYKCSICLQTGLRGKHETISQEGAGDITMPRGTHWAMGNPAATLGLWCLAQSEHSLMLHSCHQIDVGLAFMDLQGQVMPRAHSFVQTLALR